MALKRNIITTTLTQLPVLSLTIISGIIITRLIGAEGKGVYTIFIANTQLLALFLSLSANSGITYFLSSRDIETNKILGLTFYTFLIASILGVLVIFIPFHQEKLLLPVGFDSFIFKTYLYFSFLFTVSSTLFSGIFQGFKLYSIVNKISIINAFINVLSFGFLAINSSNYLFNSILLDVLLFTIIIYAINSLLWIILYVKKIKTKPTFVISLNKEGQLFFKYIGLGHVSNMLNFLNYRLDIWFVNSHNGLEQLGYYSLAVNISQMILMASTPITSVLLPYLSEEKNMLKKANLVALFSRLNSFCLVLGVCFMLLTGRYFIPFVYGKEFEASIDAFNIMNFAVLFMGLTRLFATYLASANKVIYNLYATIIGFAITIFFNILLVPKYGINGAAISSLLTYFSIFTFVYYKTRLMNINYKLNFFIFALDDYHKIKQVISKRK